MKTQHGPFDDIIDASARRWRLDPFVLKALLANESKLDLVDVGKRTYVRHHGRRRTVSGGAIGIAQFTASGIAGINRIRARRRRGGESVALFDAGQARIPQEAIPAAAELLADLIRRYGRDGGITAYNSGARIGKLVKALGFRRARRTGRLRRFAGVMLQGHRFLPNVLRRANRYRTQAGLSPLAAPAAHLPDSQRRADPALERPQAEQDVACGQLALLEPTRP